MQKKWQRILLRICRSYEYEDLLWYCRHILNKKTKLIISIFAGRAGDTGKDPIPEFTKSIKLAKKFKNVEILWASVRVPYDYLKAKQLGCHIITIPPPVIEKNRKIWKIIQSANHRNS